MNALLDSQAEAIHRLSRRNLLAMGGASTLAILGLTACSDGSAPTSTPSRSGSTSAGATASSSATSAGEPRRGGTLIASFDSDLQNIGTGGWGLYQYTIGYAQFNRLLKVTEDGGLEPELLAELPTSEDDGRKLTFKLKQGVKFHNGAELTAEDVKFSLERAMDPNSGQSAQSLFTPLGITGTNDFTSGKTSELVGIKIIDDYAFEIHLDNPNSALTGALSLPMASIVPAAYVREIGNDAFEQEKPIGTGPYKVVSYQPGRELRFERFEDYFDPEHGGYVDSVAFNLNVEPELAILRIQNNEQHLMQGPIPTGSLAALKSDPKTADQVRSGKVNNTFYGAMSLKHPAMSKLEVRQAICHAADKEKMVRQLGGGDTPAAGGLFTPLSPFFQDGISYEYDPEKSRELLKEAGYADGFDVTVLSQDSEPHKTLCQALAADLNAVGIKATANPLPQSRFSPEVLKMGPVIVVNQWELAYPHGSYIIDSTFTQSAIDAGCCNFSNFSETDFEELALKGRLAQDPAEQATLYKQMDATVVRDLALWNPLIYQGYTTLVSSELQNYSVPAIEGDVLLFSEYWLSA